MKSIREKDLEQAFLRAMNKVISGKEALIIEETDSCLGGVEDIDIRLAELQQKLMRVVRNTGIDNQEYSNLATEIERLQAHKQRVKGAEAEKVRRDRMREEFKAYLDARDGKLLDRFDGDLLRRLIEKVKVQSMVEVAFVLKRELRSSRFFDKFIPIEVYDFC